MTGFETIDWQSTSSGERIILYRHTLNLKRQLQLDWSDVFVTAFDGEKVGADYVRGFRRGNISGIRAHQIFQWIRSKSQFTVDEIEDDILVLRDTADEDENRQSATWQELLGGYCRYSNIEVFPHRTPQKGIVGFADPEPLLKLRLSLGDKFYFEINCELPGVIGALQQYRGRWYLLSLCRKERIATVRTGRVCLPRHSSNGRVDPISESVDIGKFSFLFINARTRETLESFKLFEQGRVITSEQLNDIATRLKQDSQESWAIYRCNMIIRP